MIHGCFKVKCRYTPLYQQNRWWGWLQMCISIRKAGLLCCLLYWYHPTVSPNNPTVSPNIPFILMLCWCFCLSICSKNIPMLKYMVPDTDYCGSDPCQNGGTCINSERGYQCDCIPGWIGTKCEGITLWGFQIYLSLLTTNICTFGYRECKCISKICSVKCWQRPCFDEISLYEIVFYLMYRVCDF